MRIITSGGSYADIDTYGGIIAYAELLQKQGIAAQAVTTAPLNDSIPPIVRRWQVPLLCEYTSQPEHTYTLIDISEPKYFEKFVDMERIEEIFDHHPGFENFWHERIGNQARIEQVGAACTQILEAWEQADLVHDISETSARLLMCGILDNTLNFGANITTKRDHKAYASLTRYANLPEDWPARYFRACQEVIMHSPADSLKNDVKTLAYKSYPRTVAVGQCALWDAGDIARQQKETFKRVITARESDWFMNAISISEKKSYFISDVPEVKAWLSTLLHVKFDGDIAVADRMWLRKEILKADIDSQ